METEQDNNHYFQQSLIRLWTEKQQKDLLLFNFSGFKGKINKSIKENNILDKEKIKKYILDLCIKEVSSSSIFFNRFIYNSTEKNIDGRNKNINIDIENVFLEEYKNNKNFTDNTIYNYFALQLVRTPGFLLNAYDAFVTAKGSISNLKEYRQFKYFYNSSIKDSFIYYLDKFNNGKYNSYVMNISMKNELNEDVEPFLLLSEGSTYGLGNLSGLSQIEELKKFNYQNTYISIISPSEVIFLFESHVPKEEAEMKLKTYIKYINNTSFNMVANSILINERFVNYLAEDIFYFVNNDISYFSDNKLSNLYEISKKYEK